MACDGYITLKVLELIISFACIIYKRVTDLEASQLFYFLQNRSREWALINNIFWNENGAIYADMTYGGYVIISLGLIIGQTTGELRHAKFTENFLLIMGALMYFGAAGLELAAIDSVPPGLVDNAAILGVVSLVGGLIFIIDVLLAGKRRKIPPKTIGALGYEKQTQTEGGWKAENMMTNGVTVTDNGIKKVPTNGVKILPTSPHMEQPTAPAGYPTIPVLNSNNEFVGTITPPLYTPQELKSPRVRIKSTESFLRSEKGEMPVIRRTPSPDEIVVPQGYVLVPAKTIEHAETPTPPGYASIDPKFAMIAPRKLQSPTVTTTIKTPQGYYYSTESRDPSPTEHDIPDPHQFHSQKPWPLGPKPRSYDENDSPFRRNSPFRSSKQNISESRGRFDNNELSLPADVQHGSLDGHKIEEELRKIRNITKSDADLTAEIAKENQALKHILRKEKEEKLKLKNELQKNELEERKRLEDRVNELEEYQSMLEKELKIEERKKLEKKIRELEEEKDRRMSEKEVQYFGVHDMQKSKKESSPVIHPKVSDIEEYFRESTEATKGVKEVNSKLKEKNAEKRKDDEELRKIIEEGFHFLDEDERRKRSGKLMRDLEERRSVYDKRKEMDKVVERKDDWRDDDIPSRGDTPGSASYKSEAQLWLGGKEVTSAPISPKDPGFVRHTAHNWPESTSASPINRFRFSAKHANQSMKIESSTSPSPDYPEKNSSGDEPDDRAHGKRRGLLLRKVDFPDDPVTVEVQRPATVAGNTNSWRRWLQPNVKTKLHASRSTPQ